MTRPLTIEQWTEILRRGKRRPKLQTPFLKQKNLISYLFQPDSSWVKQADLCTGRGFGKSFLLIFIATMCLARGPDEIGLFLEPDWKRVKRVFLEKWRQIVPEKYYSINKGDQCITWLPTGALLYYGPRNITGSYEGSEDSQLGQDVTFIIDDEAALRCSKTLYVNNLATIREPSDIRFYLTASTPRIGTYSDLITGAGHEIFKGSSMDNPYLPDGYVDNLRQNYSKTQARREIDGELISLEGAIWLDWSDELWPAGNIHLHEHDRDLPFYLSFDIGASSSAWLILQPLDDVWVVTAEYMPMRAGQGATDNIALKIKQDLGTPAAVVVGSDVDTHSSYRTGETARLIIRRIFGSGIPIREVKAGSPRFNKEIQYMQLSQGICSFSGKREFCVSKNLQSWPSRREHNRGILEVMQQDHWPDRIVGDNVWRTIKEHRLEHARDAAMYFAVNLGWPPGYTQIEAAA